MDVEKLAYEMFKEDIFVSKKEIKNKIKSKFKDMTEKQLNEVSLRIMNYQIDKYGYIKKICNVGMNTKTNYSQKHIIKTRIATSNRYNENKNIERMYSSRKD